MRSAAFVFDPDNYYYYILNCETTLLVPILGSKGGRMIPQGADRNYQLD